MLLIFIPPLLFGIIYEVMGDPAHYMIALLANGPGRFHYRQWHT